MLTKGQKKAIKENLNNAKFMVLNNLIDEKHILVYSAYLISLIAERNKFLDITDEEIEQVVITFVENYIKMYYGSRNTRCEITTIKNVKPFIVCAYADEKNRIVISKKQIDNLKKGKLFEFLRTVFHELIHIKQKYRIDDKCLSYSDLVQLKDRIMVKYNPEYFCKNILNLSSEIESNSYEALNSIEFMNWMYVKVTEEQEEIAKKELEKGEQASKNLTRTYNNDQQHLFDIFDEFIEDKPFLLDNYPQLTFEYVKENGLVRPKTKEELEETCTKFLNGTISFNTTEEELNNYKDFIIERKKQKTKKK